ncbi:uncharacterized protein LOC113851646 [Abrus precatorius]|uniref:Uncharacterized protein LOC113851646 n=1 Tax=Abrus precatorius TaxID=3816 RepID=A0A8B8K2I9_ABRPR|nr:uncharacterized protein LOC113851646 [Abrus precatorius]
MLATQNRQKTYADVRKKWLEFQEGDHIFLKVMPMTGVRRAMKLKKLSPQFIGPFQILKQIGPVAYQLALPSHLSNLHNVFHVSQLRKYHPDPTHSFEPESIRLKEDLTFHVSPTRIVDKGSKQLRNKIVKLVKVAWGKEGTEGFTWELESDIKREYPKLFSDCGKLTQLIKFSDIF